MKRAWILALLAGCAPASTSSPAIPGDLEFERFVAVQLPYDATLLKAGEWALYRLNVAGATHGDHYKWVVVAADPKGTWVENKMPHGETGIIRKSRFDRTGQLVEAWIGPPGGTPAQVWPKSGATAPPPPRPAATAAFREEAEPLNAAGRTFRCTKVMSEATYPDGRKGPVLTWFAKEVPFAGQTRYGGLVRRRIGRVTMELVDAGTGIGRPELEIPK